MKPTDDERIKATVRHLVKILQRFGQRSAKVIPWPSKKEAPAEARAVPKR